MLITLMKRSALIAAACLLSFSAHAMADGPNKFNLPAGELIAALKSLAKQADVELVYSPEQLKGMHTEGVRGTYSAPDAIRILLKGTPLEVHTDATGAMVIALPTPPPAAPPAEKSSAPPKSSQTTDGGQSAPPGRTLQLAQADSTAPGPEVDQGKSKQEPAQLQEVVVTGSYLRGVEPVSPVLTISREDIEQSGYPSVGTYLQSLPENFSGGDNFNVAGVGGQGINGGRSIVSQASTANLRGIGTDSTLTLIDGHRLGYDGNLEAVDLSLVPLAAVERIEVATDGASAIYGSDAVAGVVNVILRKDYDGAETKLTATGTSDGGGSQQQYSQILGKNFGSGNAVFAYEYSKNDSLLASERSVSEGAAPPFDLLPEQTRNSFFTAGSYRFSPGLSARLEGLYASKRNDVVEDDGYGTVTHDSAFVHLFGVDGGIDYSFFHDGLLSLDLNAAGDKMGYDETFTSSAGVTPAQGGYYSQVRSAEVKLQSPAFDIPTGQVRFALGGGYRKEYLDEYGFSWERGIAYQFAELNVPLAAKSITRVGLERLDLDASVRHERYSQIGDTTNPRIGIVYAPLQDIALKASWGTSFRAPSLDDLHQEFQAGLFPGSFFGAPATSTVLYALGPTGLKPQTSRSWTTSVQYQPVEHPGLSATLTYYDISYRERIASPMSNPLVALSNPLYSSFVTLNPSQALQQYWEQGIFLNNSGAPYDPNNVYALILNGIANVQSQRIHGIDTRASYSWETDIGKWTIAANASWLDLIQYVLPGSAAQRINGTVFNPPTWKGRASFGWDEGPWSAIGFVNYVSSETDNNATPSAQVGSWTTFDGQVAYDFQNPAGFLHGLAVHISVLNILNREPPVLRPGSTLPPGVGFDAANYSAVGRAGSITLSKAW